MVIAFSDTTRIADSSNPSGEVASISTVLDRGAWRSGEMGDHLIADVFEVHRIADAQENLAGKEPSQLWPERHHPGLRPLRSRDPRASSFHPAPVRLSLDRPLGSGYVGPDDQRLVGDLDLLAILQRQHQAPVTLGIEVIAIGQHEAVLFPEDWLLAQAGGRYRSARHEDGTCVVLFVPHEDCVSETLR